MKFGFDLISDLELTDSDVFDWEGKSTSLFCLIAGNISDNLRVVQKTLKILSKCCIVHLIPENIGSEIFIV